MSDADRIETAELREYRLQIRAWLADHLERYEGVVRFAIADRGLGILVGERERIFEKFYWLDFDMVCGIGGTGLGLYISRELVRRVHGRIWVEPNGSQGSVFYVELPAALEPAVAKNPRGRARASA